MYCLSGNKTSASIVTLCNTMNIIFAARVIKDIMLLLFNDVDVSMNKILQSANMSL